MKNTSQLPSGREIPVLALCSALFSDFLGFTVLIAYLPIFFADNDCFSKSKNGYLLFGAFLATYSFFQALGNFTFSRLFKEKNFRFFLTLSYLGNIIGYLLGFFGIYTRQLILLYLGNALSGFLGMHMATSQTLILKDASYRVKSQRFHASAMIIGIAFLLGPWFFKALWPLCEKMAGSVFLFSALLSFFSLGVILKCIPKEFVSQEQENFSTWKLAHKDLQVYAAIFFFSFGWSLFIKFFQFFLISYTAISKADSSLWMSYFGLGVFLSQLFLSQKKQEKEAPKSFLISLAILAMLMVGISFMRNEVYILFFLLLLSLLFGYIQPAIPLLLSQKSHSHTQGRIMGMHQSSLALGKVLAPLLGGLYFGFVSHVSFFAGAISLLLSLILFTRLFYAEKLLLENG
jgi:MFS transporter, DHA1 family, multidrug resistance protein